MDWLRKLLARVVAQLRGLSLSQRLAILLGGALVGVSLFWLIQWTATPDMVPLLSQDFAAEDLARARDGLERMNTPYKLVGQKIMVPAATNRQVVIAHLQQQDKLPADTSTGFDALVKEANPWISQAEHERRWAVALKHELEQVLRQFDGVRSASVFLPLTSQSRGFGHATPAAGASVTLTMQSGQPVPRELALAAARLVTGAVRGLALKNVEVLDGNGVSALDWESEAAGITALDRKRRTEEQAIQKKIANQLPDPKALVSVQAELELTNQSVESETPGKTVETESETTEEQTTRIRGGGQPGVQANVGVAAGGRSGADESTVKNTSKSKLQPGITRKTEATPPGGVKEVWAAVNISHSYLMNVYRRANPGADEPTEAQIQQVFEREKPRVTSQITKLVKPQDDKHVAVDWYYDAAAESEPAARATTVDDTFQLVRRYGPQSALGLLALVSLALMFRMARRSDASESFGLEIGLPEEAIEAAHQAARAVGSVSHQRSRTTTAGTSSAGEIMDGVMEVEPVSVGQATVTEGVLVAQEVDERTVQTHKMLEQVAQVVEADPEASAGLLEQWVQRSDSFSG